MMIIFFGPPGSGKGTQSQYLTEKKGFVHLSTGDLIRNEILNRGPLAEVFERVISEGSLVDDQYMLTLVENYLKENKEKELIFDGFPRTVNQAMALDSLLQKQNQSIAAFIYFEISFEKLAERILGRFACAQCNAVYHEVTKPTKVLGQCDSCGGHVFQRRSDDSLEVLEKRFAIYSSQAEQIREYYHQKGCLKVIDASKDFESVRLQVEEILKKCKENVK